MLKSFPQTAALIRNNSYFQGLLGSLVAPLLIYQKGRHWLYQNQRLKDFIKELDYEQAERNALSDRHAAVFKLQTIERQASKAHTLISSIKSMMLFDTLQPHLIRLEVLASEFNRFNRCCCLSWLFGRSIVRLQEESRLFEQLQQLVQIIKTKLQIEQE